MCPLASLWAANCPGGAAEQFCCESSSLLLETRLSSSGWQEVDCLSPNWLQRRLISAATQVQIITIIIMCRTEYEPLNNGVHWQTTSQPAFITHTHTHTHTHTPQDRIICWPVVCTSGVNRLVMCLNMFASTSLSMHLLLFMYICVYVRVCIYACVYKYMCVCVSLFLSNRFHVFVVPAHVGSERLEIKLSGWISVAHSVLRSRVVVWEDLTVRVCCRSLHAYYYNQLSIKKNSKTLI